MSFRDMLVHAPDHRRWSPHVGYAARLAARRHMHLIGLHAVRGWIGIPGEAGAIASHEAVQQAESERGEAEQASGHFEQFAQALGVRSAQWQVGEGDAPACLALAGAAADVVVLGLGEQGRRGGTDLVERTLLQSRTPCLVVPDAAAAFDGPIDSILVAWNGSLEAMRAVHAALPLLATASHVRLLKGRPRQYPATMPVPPPLHLEQYLSRHGVAFEVLPTQPEDDKPGASLLAQAQAMQAQLVVMGAYGHPRVSEWIMGGATHHALRNSPIPLFMAH